MSKVRLERWEASDGPLTEKRMMGLMHSDGYEVASYAYRPGTVFAPHKHAQDKCDGVLEGVLRIVVGAERSTWVRATASTFRPERGTPPRSSARRPSSLSTARAGRRPAGGEIPFQK